MKIAVGSMNRLLPDEVAARIKERAELGEAETGLAHLVER
jgi:hypothetical protein